MKLLFIILLAGYAVRSSAIINYVIEVPEDPPAPASKKFHVYWNVPTQQCSSKKVYFKNLYDKFGIIQNVNDKFNGTNVTILYDPGRFPAILKNETSGKFRFRNGGVPQRGNLTIHLEEFKNHVDSAIPDKNFSGVAVINFESWRPIFRQNFGTLQPYKNLSIVIERKLHWWWKTSCIKAEAKRRFEEAGRTFMQTTLAVAKQLRPHGVWGYYAYPYCFNMATNNLVEQCASGVPEENDQISWLWSESMALYPSVYSSVDLTTSQLVSLIRGRVNEAARCAQKHCGPTDILPYFWYRYRDAGFLTETDLTMALSTIYASNATGIMIWGGSEDVNTVDKCKALLNYTENVLGPAIAKYTKSQTKLYDENDTSTTTRSLDNISTESPIFNENVSTQKDSTTEGFTEPFSNTITDTTEQNDDMFESSTNSITVTKYVDSTETTTETDDYDTFDISTSTPNLGSSDILVRSFDESKIVDIIRNDKNNLENEDTTAESSQTTFKEETSTSIVPTTSIEQVVVY